MTLDEAREFIASVPWTAAKWARETDARHEYVMEFWPEVASGDFAAFARHIKAVGYKARWGPNPVTGKSYSNVYFELEPWTYWWFPRCLNREHRSVDTLPSPVSAAEADAQLRLG